MKVLIGLSIIALLVDKDWFGWGVAAVWGLVGIVKLLKYMERRGAFD